MISKHDTDNKNLPIAKYHIGELLPRSLTSAPAVSTRKEDLVWAATGMLAHHIESFTDTLVVTEGERPAGMLGGFEIIDQVSKNPTSSLFYETTVEKIMNNNLIITSKQTKLSNLLSQWQERRRAFAIIPNQYHGYS
ncbi:MAG: CBS domain-containing protein, partial [Thaumarchaeota archaeon]|nr:CBS domain-containing protein [Nitrososphaerota archaeon]